MRHTVTNLVLLVVLLAGCAIEDADQDGVVRGVDCNDQDPSQGWPVPLHVDGDRDGHGGPTREIGCLGNGWLVATGDDCNDDDATVHPGAREIGCDGRDNDCDATTVDGPAYTEARTWPSVQQAIDAQVGRAQVRLCASRIREHLTITKPIELLGAGAERTVLDAGDIGATTLRIEAPATIRDLTIRGGVAMHGGGVAIEVPAGQTVALIDVSIRDNAAREGGGVWLGAGTLVLERALVFGNVASARGGGVYALTKDQDSVVIVDSDIRGNHSAEGGGVWLDGALSLVGALIAENTADRGGGLHLGGTADAVRSSIAANSAAEGGGIWGSGSLSGVQLSDNLADSGGGLLAAGPMVLQGVVIAGNRALLGDGGGVAARAELELLDTVVQLNEAAGRGGGVHAGAYAAIQGGTIEQNVAPSGAGLALLAGGHLAGVHLRHNVAYQAGGGLYVSCSAEPVVLEGGSLEGNLAEQGAGILVEGAAVNAVGLQVMRNVAVDGGGAVALLPGCGEARLDVGADVGWTDNVTYDLVLGGDGMVAPSDPFTCTVSASAVTCSDPD